MTEVVSRLKPDLTPCVCGCGLEARPRVKAWSDGLGPHARGCKCRRCSGGRQAPRARRRENRIARDISGERQPMSGALNGVDVLSLHVEVEETANVALLAGLRRWWESKQTNVKLARLREHSRRSGVPYAFIASWERRPRVVVMDYESFVTLCQWRAEDEAV